MSGEDKFPPQLGAQLRGVFREPAAICEQYHDAVVRNAAPLPIACGVALVAYAVIGSLWTGAFIGAAIPGLGAREGAWRLLVCVGPCWPALLPLLALMNRLARPRLPLWSLGFLTFVTMTYGMISNIVLSLGVFAVSFIISARATMIVNAALALALAGLRMWVMQYQIIRRLGGQPLIVPLWWALMVALAFALGSRYHLFG